MDIEEELRDKVFMCSEDKDRMADKINNLINVIHLFRKEIGPKDLSFFFNDDDEPYIQLYDENGDAIASIYARY